MGCEGARWAGSEAAVAPDAGGVVEGGVVCELGVDEQLAQEKVCARPRDNQLVIFPYYPYSRARCPIAL